jgi:TPR repeat protein
LKLFSELKKDLKESVKWLDKAAKFGHPEAAFDLANILLSGGGIVERNPQYAYLLFCQAAEHGHEGAQKILKEKDFFQFGPMILQHRQLIANLQGQITRLTAMLEKTPPQAPQAEVARNQGPGIFHA